MVKLLRRRRPVRRPRRKMRMGKKKAVGRSGMKRTSDYAKCVEIQETTLVAQNNNVGESLGGNISFMLADFQRPQEIAHAYKYYRASKVEVSFIPYYNIAQTGGGAVTRMPQLYYTVDRVGNQWIVPTEGEMLERGVSPKLFNKKHKLSFKPNLLQIVDLEAVDVSGVGQGVPITIQKLGAVNSVAIFDKWLPTQQTSGYTQGAIGTIVPKAVNPYALRYYGCAFVPSIEGVNNVSVPCGDIQVKVTWEFKGPRVLRTTYTTQPFPEPNPAWATSTNTNATPNTQPTEYT